MEDARSKLYTGEVVENKNACNANNFPGSNKFLAPKISVSYLLSLVTGRH